MKRIMACLQSLDASLVSILSECGSWDSFVIINNPDAHLSNLGSDRVRNRELRRSPVLTFVFFLFCVQLFPFANLAAQSAPARTESLDIFPSKSWRTLSSPEKYGWSKEKLAAAQAYANADSIHTSAVMIVQGGEVVDQWGDFDKKIDCYSIRKSTERSLWNLLG
jgi:hypothetical protein